jgi:hypothetical protein
VSTRRRIPELSAIEFTGSRAITAYSKEGRDLCREMSWEFEMGADEVEGALRASQKGHPLLMGVDVKWRARRVANRLRRAADFQVAAGVELVKFRVQFRTEFADVLMPPKKKPSKKFDFEDE